MKYSYNIDYFESDTTDIILDCIEENGSRHYDVYLQHEKDEALIFDDLSEAKEYFKLLSREQGN
ncbi:MAG: Unknown protein [uncultured Sulfurovum sp.]|uniref:Uncharacterized protein n=1 Tax=uncultured Sulfurovum sp. TaxID=269237 RepID=A0A6S6S9D9_9BACT|nr:MAG: Unknown protein [uncultured Sulfurovum sp.]